jgi:ribonuclease R
MFMVEANEAVASILDRHNVPLMRRIHPEPDAFSMQNLSKLVRALGYSLPRMPDRTSIQELLAAVSGTDSALAVNLVVLRSFEKAQYAPLHIGHFALASKWYCHFTSPIRRYADLLVHRVLQCYLQDKLGPSNEILAEQDLTEVGKHITFTEQRAEDAERELQTVLILQMLSDKIGDELDCVVTGLAGFGVFVQSLKFGIEGLIAMESLGPDKWKFSSKTQNIIGLNSGATVHLGRAIKARIVSVNVPARQLNLCPTKPLAEVSVRKRPKQGVRKSKKPRIRKRPRGRR